MSGGKNSNKSKTLYLGIDPPPGVFHYPVIRVEPMALPQEALSMWERSTHGLFTSKNAVRFWPLSGKERIGIAIGPATASSMRSAWRDLRIPEQTTQEGIVFLLEEMDLRHAFLFYPHSHRARPLLVEYLKRRNLSFYHFALYKTVLQRPDLAIDLSDFEEIVFTSPSTVEAFFHIFKNIPDHIRCRSIGPVTQRALGISNTT